jgi:hypothetical protein
LGKIYPDFIGFDDVIFQEFSESNFFIVDVEAINGNVKS